MSSGAKTRLKLLLPVLSAVIMGFAIVCVSVSIITSKEITDNINDVSKSKVEKLALYCDEKIDKWKTQVKLIAGTSEIINNVKNKDFDKNKTFIEVIKKISLDVESFGVCDTGGNVITDTGVRADLSSRDYVQNALKGQTVISEPLISKITNNQVVSFATPIYEGKKIIGAYIQTLSLKSLSDEINKEKIGVTGYAFMLDKNGTFIAHQDKTKVMKEKLSKNADKSASDIEKRMIAGETDFSSYIYDGVERIVYFAPLKSTRWSLAAGASKNEIFKEQNYIKVMLIVISIVMVLIVSAAIVISVGNFIKPILKIVKATEQVSKGNLKIKVDIYDDDEIGKMAQALNKMIKNLKDIIINIKEAASNVASTAEQTSATTEEIASSSQNQSAASEETLSSMEELDASIQNISKNVQEVSSHIQSVNSLIKEMEVLTAEVEQCAQGVYDQSQNSIKATDVGQEAVNKTKTGMDEINEAVSKLVMVIKGLGKSAVDIGEIVDVIDDIAEQTNLLALNAAIEAARAGEHGRGFAVVADAVRSLAEKSGEATKEITTLIRGIQDEVNSAVDTAKEGAKQVEEGVTLAVDTEEALQTIKEAVYQTSKEAMAVKELITKQNIEIRHVVDSTNTVNELADSMAATVEEQTASSSEVVRAVENISESANNIATGTGEIASSADSLAKEAQNLTTVISEFKVD